MKSFTILLKNELKLNLRNMNMVIFAILMPLVTNGFCVSNGMAFLFTVICTSSSIFSSSLPVSALSVKSSSMRWLSVPPETIFTPSFVNSSAIAAAFLTICF